MFGSRAGECSADLASDGLAEVEQCCAARGGGGERAFVLAWGSAALESFGERDRTYSRLSLGPAILRMNAAFPMLWTAVPDTTLHLFGPQLAQSVPRVVLRGRWCKNIDPCLSTSVHV